MVCSVFLLLPKVDSYLRLAMRRDILKMPTMQPPGGRYALGRPSTLVQWVILFELSRSDLFGGCFPE